MSGRLLFSVFNTVFKTYSSKLIPVNSYITFFHHCKYPNSYAEPNAINRSVQFSTQQNDIATYEEVKDIGTGKHKNVWLIDVREPEELVETGALPGSINIPLGDIESIIKNMSDKEFLAKYGREKPNKNCHIVFSCKLGKRSAKAQYILQQMGYKNQKLFGRLVRMGGKE